MKNKKYFTKQFKLTIDAYRKGITDIDDTLSVLESVFEELLLISYEGDD